MGPNQAWELFHSKGNHKQSKKTSYRQGEKFCKWYNQQGLNFQNIQTADTTQQNENIQPNQKMARS